MTTTTLRPPVHTVVLPAALVALDIEVREEFLSDDMETICGAAAKAHSTVLISNAGHSLKQRAAAFSIWRKDGLEKLAQACPAVSEFLSHHQALAAEFEAGTIDLLQLDRLMHDADVQRSQQRMALLCSQKDNLREALAMNCEDVVRGGMPRVLVVRGTGEMKLLKTHAAGKAWGAIGNSGFYLIPLSTEDMRRWLPES